MATYKTGWMKKLIDGVSTKIFTISHVKAVYYDYANSKTLKSKLDDMDTSISEKASYEVGTFSPRFIGSPAATETRARYIKIGRIVHIFMSFEFTTAVKVSTDLGDKIIALPFAISDSQPTHGYYPASVKVNGGNYGGLAMYENYMETSPAISLSNITEDNETKIVRVCGQYETNA